MGAGPLAAQSMSHEAHLIRIGKDNHWISLPLADVQGLPKWTPMDDAPAPFSFADAWRLAHAQAVKDAGDSGVTISWVDMQHGQDSAESIWFYDLHTYYRTIKDGAAYTEQNQYLVPMDGILRTASDEIFNVKVVDPAVPPKLNPVYYKPYTGPLPDNIQLTEMKSSSDPTITYAFTVPKNIFQALPAWDFQQPDPPPFSFDQALAVVRQKVTAAWPDGNWKFVDIRLEHGQTSMTGCTYYYVMTVTHEGKTPAGPTHDMWVQVVLMDGTWIGPDPSQIEPFSKGFSRH
jgi:hypothetical protein